MICFVRTKLAKEEVVMQYIIVFFLSFIFLNSTLFSSDGSLDQNFGFSGIVSRQVQTSTLNGQNTATAVQQDGKIVVVGNANSGFAVARYDAVGRIDGLFNNGNIIKTTVIGSSAAAHGVAIDNQGRIVVCGVASGRFSLARYLPNGALDTVANGGTGFGHSNPALATGYVTTIITSSLASIAYNLVIDKNNRILVCGGATISGSSYVALACYTSQGVLDTTFGTSSSGMVTNRYENANSTAYGITLDSNNKILLCGFSGPRSFVARYTSSGALDNSLGGQGFLKPSGIGSNPTVAYGILVDSDNKIVISGSTTVSGELQLFIARILANGSDIDSTFNSPNGYVIQDIGTDSVAYSIALDTNNNILMGGANTTNLFVGRYTSTGVLDTTFNAPNGYNNSVALGANPGISRCVLQQDNKLVVSATAQGLFTTARYLGDVAPQGCMDSTYNTWMDTSGYVAYPTDDSSGNKPQVKALQILSNNSVFVLTENLAAATKSQLVQIDADGSTTSANAIATIDIAQTGGVDVICDSHGRALVVGGNGSNGWIARYVPTAGSPGTFALDTMFNDGSIIIQSSSPTTTAYARVCEQPSGNILALGQNGSTGIIVAYNQDGTVNTHFGTSGVYSIANCTLSDMVVDSVGRIYVIGGIAGGNITLYRILADGSDFDVSYNFGNPVDTGLATASYQAAKLAAITTAGVATLMTIHNSTYDFEIQQYATSGAAGSAESILQSKHLLTNPTLQQLQIDTNNQPVYVGYDSYVVFVGRLTSDLAIDTTFSPYSQLCPGILTTMYSNNNPSRVAHCIGIAPLGAIQFGGYENIDASNTISTVGRVVGNESYSQIARYPGAEIGQVDTTFGTNGALSLADAPASLSGGTVQAMYVVSNNKILVADATGSDTELSQLSSQYALDTGSFGSGTGKVTLAGLSNPKNIQVDLSGNIYVVGDNGAHMMLFKVTSQGVVAWSITSGSLTTGNVVLQLVTGLIAVAGYDGSSGVIAGYDPSSGNLVTSFASSGYYATGVASQIIGAAVTSAGSIVFTYNNSGSAIVNCLLSTGLVDPDFTFGTALTDVSADDQMRLQVDINGKIIVIARNSTGNFVARRYLVTGADDVATVTITLTNPSTSTLTQLLSLSNGTTLIVGKNSNGTTLIITRLDASFALDSNFNYATGLLETAVEPMTDFDAIAVTADQGILVAGASVTPSPYVTRLYDDAVVTKVNQSATELMLPGTLDVHFNDDGTHPGYVNMHTELAAADVPGSNIAKSGLLLNDGSYFVASDNGTDTYINKIGSSNTITPVSAFGTSGLLTIPSCADVAVLFLDQTGYLLVAGGTGASGSNAGWLKQYDATTGAQTSFALTTTLDVVTAVAQQTNGRYIVAGQKDGVGTLIAYNSLTGAVDTTFGSSGIYSTGYNSSIAWMAIDDQDNMYIISNNGTEGTTQQIAPNGLLTLWTGSTTIANASNSSSRLALDQNGNVVVASVNATPSIVMNRYDYNGGGAELATLTLADATTGLTSPVITALIIDATPSSAGNIILTGYDDSTPFVIRVLADLSGLDTSFNASDTNPGVQSLSVPTATQARWYSGFITADGNIMSMGYATLSGINTPYMINLFGNAQVGQYTSTVAAGTPGTIDTNFATSGMFDLASLGAGALNGCTPKAVLPMSNGGYYIAFQDPNNMASQVVRLTNGLALDTSYHTTGFAEPCSDGVYSMMMDGAGCLLLAGGTWLNRLATDGSLDTTFGTGGQLVVNGATLITTVVQQTLGRYVAGGLHDTNGALFAYTNAGDLDTTFNSTGDLPGLFLTGSSSGIYSLVADQYDRLIIAYENAGNVDLVRLTSAGQYDTTFNSTGTVSSAIVGADDETQVRVTLDNAGNIIVAAHTSSGISVRGFTADGNVLYAQLDIATGITNSPVVTNLIATTDGKVLVGGYQSTASPMWVARVTLTGVLDTSFGNTDGIMTYSFDGSATERFFADNAIYGDGQIVMVGTETDGTINPFLSFAYATPYTTEIPICQNAKAVGTNDSTLGASSTSSAALGVVFYAAAAATNGTANQIARAISLQDDATIVVAVDGAATNGGSTSSIFLKMFDIDGSPSSAFGTNGQQTVLAAYQNQFVNDMVTFTTVSGVHKAILAGHVTNSALNLTQSLLLQYNVDTHTLDTNFGSSYGNPTGVVSGHAQQFNVVGLQSNGRVIASGMSADSSPAGVIAGYTGEGILDCTFGISGLFKVADSTGIYTHAIDTKNRIVMAFQDTDAQASIARCLSDGSAFDTLFAGGMINTLQKTYSNDGIRVALDSLDNVFAAVVADNYAAFTLYAYDAVAGIELHQSFTPSLSLTHFVITKLIVNVDGNLIIVGYDTNDDGADELVIACVLGDLSGLDVSFNPDGAIPGCIKYAIASGTTQTANDALIHPDGRILLVGSEN